MIYQLICHIDVRILIILSCLTERDNSVANKQTHKQTNKQKKQTLP